MISTGSLIVLLIGLAILVDSFLDIHRDHLERKEFKRITKEAKARGNHYVYFRGIKYEL